MNEKMKKRLQSKAAQGSGPITDDQLKKWLLESNLDQYGFDTDKFGHINKNMSTANLNSGQAEELIRTSENVQLIRHFNRYVVKIVDEDATRAVFRAYDKEDARSKAEAWAQEHPEKAEDAAVQEEWENRHTPVLNVLVDNITATEKASGGKALALLRTIKTLFMQEDKTVEDKSSSNRQGFIQSLIPSGSSGGRR